MFKFFAHDACNLGQHVHLSFSSYTSIVSEPFEYIHSDLWISPLPAVSGITYYVYFLITILISFGCIHYKQI